MHLTTASRQLQEALTKHIATLSGTYCWEKTQRQAHSYFQKLGLPSAKTEGYKYTPITNVLSEKFDLSNPSAQIDASHSLTNNYIKPFLHQLSDVYAITVIDGEINNTSLHSALPQSLFHVSSFTEAYQKYQNIFTEHFSQDISNNLDTLAILNTALFTNGTFIYIPDNTRLDKPLCIYHFTDSTTQQKTTYPRVLIYVGKNSQISLINNWHTMGAYDGFTNAVTDILVGEHSQLDHYTLQIQAGNAYQVNTIHCYQASHSIVNNYTFSWDGLLIRNNLYTDMQGPHAQVNMYGIYCPSQTQHIDNHTTVNHQHPNTESNQLYKGILSGKATGVFNGKIFVQSEAQKTNAFQTNNNILLSDEATIYTKPQLEIWADDVKCSHGATIGQLDETQLFYLQARGIPENLARHMLLHAFADEVISKVPLVSLLDYLRENFKPGY